MKKIETAIKVYAIGIFCLLFLQAPIKAQDNNGLNIPGFGETVPQTGRSDVGVATDYFIGSPDKDVLMIKVNIWGQVRRPGYYTIPVKTDLVTFISFAGGPLEKAKLDNVKIIRHDEGKSEVLKINVKKYLNTADLALIPDLKPGDTVIVAGSILHLFSTTVQYLTQLMTVITFYNIVTQLGK